MAPELTGRCQCGNATYRLRKPPPLTVVCHCTECQRLSAGAFSMSMIVEKEDFEPSGPLSVYERPTTSGATARCFFCPTCGNRVFHDAGEDDPRVRVKLPLEQRDQIRPRLQIWMQSRQPWLGGLTGGLQNLPGFQTQTLDKSVAMRRISLGYGWTAARLGLQALGMVCIGIVAWQWLAT